MCDEHTLSIHRPAPAVALVVLSGSDIGEFGDLAMRELKKDLAPFKTIELFIDARATSRSQRPSCAALPALRIS